MRKMRKSMRGMRDEFKGGNCFVACKRVTRHSQNTITRKRDLKPGEKSGLESKANFDLNFCRACEIFLIRKVKVRKRVMWIFLIDGRCNRPLSLIENASSAQSAGMLLGKS